MTKNDYIAKFGVEAYERWLEHNRKNYQKRKDVWRKTRQNYYANNKEYFREYYLNYNKTKRETVEGHARFLLYQYRHFDKLFNKGECTLTFDWLMEHIFNSQTCSYCNESDPLKLGCDRIDNSKGHTPENCVPCCHHCNVTRSSKTQEEYIDYLSRICQRTND